MWVRILCWAREYDYLMLSIPLSLVAKINASHSFNLVSFPLRARKGESIHPPHRMHHDVTQRQKGKPFILFSSSCPFFFRTSFCPYDKDTRKQNLQGKEKKKGVPFWMSWGKERYFWVTVCIRLNVPNQQTNPMGVFFACVDVSIWVPECW